MNFPTITSPIPDRLPRRESRAAAAAIGHGLVLGGATPAMQIQGLRALATMVCDWVVVILEETITDPVYKSHVRRFALTELRALVQKAVRRGYRGITHFECFLLEMEARDQLGQQQSKVEAAEIPALDTLASHLSEAVTDGLFGELPDY